MVDYHIHIEKDPYDGEGSHVNFMNKPQRAQSSQRQDNKENALLCAPQNKG